MIVSPKLSATGMVAAIIVLLVLAISTFFLVTSRISESLVPKPIPFDSQMWKNQSHRWAMCKDLVANYKLVGMSKDDIIRLLGPPDKDRLKQSRSKFATEKVDRLCYELGWAGPENYLAALYLYLKDDVVVSYELKAPRYPE